MDEMTAFERQIAGEVGRMAGPGRRVDAMALVRTVTTPPSRWSATARLRGRVSLAPTQGEFSMSSALRFAVAGVIVALFGGFLLTGILTTRQGDVPPEAATESPTPMTTEMLLSGMVTDEVEPGVFRVLNDGVRSLSPPQARRIATGHDGNIRLLDDEGFYRLGSEEYHKWPKPLPYGYSPNTNPVLEVAPDGTMWVIGAWSQLRPDIRSGSPLRSSDGEEWTVQPCPGESVRTETPGDCSGVAVAPDGTAWASWAEGTYEENGARVGQFGPTGWQPLDGHPRIEFDRMAFTDAGDLYGIGHGWSESVLDRYADGVWQERVTGFVVDVGRDGTVWSDAGACGFDPSRPCGQDGLARFAGGEWEDWTSADLPEISLGFAHDGEFRVAPDGSLWLSLWRSADGTDPREDEEWQATWNHGDDLSEFLACDGLARFDGQTLDRFMTGECISMDISADGSVWVLGDTGLYVITPEAVAGRE